MMWEPFGDYQPVSLTTNELKLIYNALERNESFHYNLGYDEVADPEAFTQDARISLKRRIQGEIGSRKLTVKQAQRE